MFPTPGLALAACAGDRASNVPWLHRFPHRARCSSLFSANNSEEMTKTGALTETAMRLADKFCNTWQSSSNSAYSGQILKDQKNLLHDWTMFAAELWHPHVWSVSTFCTSPWSVNVKPKTLLMRLRSISTVWERKLLKRLEGKYATAPTSWGEDRRA